MPLLMGVLNLTPDSFSDGGKYLGSEVARAKQLLFDGADILDIGGESTRPGAQAVELEEELRRVLPTIRALSGQLGDKRISIDTSKAAVAEAALREGASIVNDVSGGLFDPALLGVVAARKATLILGHTRGRPAVMATQAKYADVVCEVQEELGARIAAARTAGIEQVWIDPGLGFAKEAEHCIALLAHLDEFRSLGCPIVVGASRKRFLSFGGEPRPPREREEATAAAHAIAVWLGADVVRVHDVAAQAPAMRLVAACRSARRIG